MSAFQTSHLCHIDALSCIQHCHSHHSVEQHQQTSSWPRLHKTSPLPPPLDFYASPQPNRNRAVHSHAISCSFRKDCCTGLADCHSWSPPPHLLKPEANKYCIHCIILYVIYRESHAGYLVLLIIITLKNVLDVAYRRMNVQLTCIIACFGKQLHCRDAMMCTLVLITVREDD